MHGERTLTNFARYLARAETGPVAYWRVLSGLAVIIAIWVMTFAAMMVIFVLGVALWSASANRGVDEALSVVLSPSRPVAMLLYLAGFAGVWIGAAAAMRLCHRRRLADLYGWAARIVWGDVWRGGLAAALAITMLFGAGLAVFEAPVRTDVSREAWLTLLAPVAVLVCVQSSAEELLFRGYLMQTLGARSRSVLVWGLAPALLFALLHIQGGSVADAQAGPPAWAILAATFIAGAELAVLAWWTGGLGAPMAAHAVNNLVAFLLVTPSTEIGKVALYTDPFMMRADWPLWASLTMLAAIALQAGLTLGLFWGLFRGLNRAPRGRRPDKGAEQPVSRSG